MCVPGMRLRIPLLLTAAILPLTLATGCQKAPAASADSGKTQGHHHHPPHGGTPVVLGDEDYHIELVLDREAGKLQAYVLDDEMEDFVRVAAPSIVITATSGGPARELVLAAVANPVTGETVGDTSLFEAQADWLRTATQFDGMLRTITIRGATYTGVKFNFPKGNDTDG
jgi:hypothetical protein